MNILFLTESREDYLADSILHGLISLETSVIDYPRKDVLYSDTNTCRYPLSQSVRGNGFTLYGLLRDSGVDRSLVIQKLQSRWFDLVIFGQVWRQWGQLLDMVPFLAETPVILLDGDDDTRLFHKSRTLLKRYGLQFRFPLDCHKTLYFKRELYSESYWSLPGAPSVKRISFSIPAEKIISPLSVPKRRRIATHCVDTEVAEACGLSTSYAFDSEEDYYADIAASKYAVTMKRGGWDCLRHYEIAAAGALLCFRQLDQKPDTCAPHGLVSNQNCISYTCWRDLSRKLDYLDSRPDQYERLLYASNKWIQNNTTLKSALRMLETASALWV